jgi:hypothetical protein
VALKFKKLGYAKNMSKEFWKYQYKRNIKLNSFKELKLDIKAHTYFLHLP